MSRLTQLVKRMAKATLNQRSTLNFTKTLSTGDTSSLPRNQILESHRRSINQETLSLMDSSIIHHSTRIQPTGPNPTNQPVNARQNDASIAQHNSRESKVYLPVYAHQTRRLCSASLRSILKARHPKYKSTSTSVPCKSNDG